MYSGGSLWRGPLAPPRGGISGAPVPFTSFGSGNPPVISGADSVKSWSLDHGYIYGAALGKRPGNVYVDGGPGWGLRAASAVSSMTAGSWYWDSGQARVYVWLADKSNPSGHTIEAAVRTAGFQTSSGICSDISYMTIRGLTFEHTSGYGIYIHCFSGPSPVAGIVIQSNTIRQTGTGQYDGGQYYNGILFLQEPAYSNAAPKILSNTIYYTGGHGNGINLQGANSALIYGNRVSFWNHDGIDIKNANGVMVSTNIAHDRLTGGAAYYIEYGQATFERNIAYNTSNGFQVSTNASAHVYNNSIYSSPTAVYFGPHGTSISVVNNAVKGSATGLGTDGSSGLTEDYNNWGLSPMFSIKSSRYTFAQWLTMGSHHHDLAVDPLWSSAPTNFALRQTSRCVNAGASVGLPYDGSAPDLGAFESAW